MSGVLLFNGCYNPPFDEGVKLLVHHLRNELAHLTPVHMVTTAEGVSPVIVIPKETWKFVREAIRHLMSLV